MRTAVCIVPLVLLLTGCGGEEPEAPTPDVVPKATVVEGGQLYDKFWKVSEADEPQATHPLWAKRSDTASNKRSGSSTWRCKECHGWDYKGADGVYAKGAHRTGFGGVLGSTLSAAEMRASIADAHGYREAGLSDLELDSLVLFLREGLVDSATYIDENGAFRGDAKRGRRLYERGLGGAKSCATCHGLDGRKAPEGAGAVYDDFVGKIANDNPWEFLHKVRFGQPGTPMPSTVARGVPIQDVIDVSAYAQTLPKEK